VALGLSADVNENVAVVEVVGSDGASVIVVVGPDWAVAGAEATIARLNNSPTRTVRRRITLRHPRNDREHEPHARK
jgi:hypothetical protein